MNVRTQMAKKDQPTKARFISLIGQMPGVVSSVEIDYSDPNAPRIVGIDPKTLRVERFYKRDVGKDKILASVPAREGVAVEIAAQLRNQFDRIAAVDTNTESFDGERLSVTVVYATPPGAQSFEGGQAHVYVCAFVVRNCRGEPERLGWKLAMEALDRRFGGSRTRWGLVVDATIGAEMMRINARAEPYHKEQLLPLNVQLIYGSDQDPRALPGQMILSCHSQARRGWEDVRSFLQTPPRTPATEDYDACYELLG